MWGSLSVDHPSWCSKLILCLRLESPQLPLESASTHKGPTWGRVLEPGSASSLTSGPTISIHSDILKTSGIAVKPFRPILMLNFQLEDS